MNKLKGTIRKTPKLSGEIRAQIVTVGTGEDGATFIPVVSENGVISWTNDKGLENPQPVNIKGPQGETGSKGDTGDAGKDGYTPIKGTDYFTEADKAEIVEETVENIPTATTDIKGLVKVGDGLTMNGDVLSVYEGKYTLVHEVTTTEEVNRLYYNCNAEKIYFELKVPATGKDNAEPGVIIINGNNVNYFMYMTRPTENRLSKGVIVIDDGMLRGEDCGTMVDGVPWTLDYTDSYRFLYFKGGYFTDKITSIEIGLSQTDKTLPIGTTFKVYEVK